MAALAACAPPKPAPRVLDGAGLTPGIGADAIDAVTPPAEGATFRYAIATPLRNDPSAMTVTIARTGETVERRQVVRIPASSMADARVIAVMAEQSDAREAEIDGTDVILRAVETADRRGRLLSTDFGATRVTYDPHDCFATTGLCKTVRTGADGRQRFLAVQTSEQGGIWREEIRLDPGRDPQGRSDLIRETLYTVDASGMLIDLNRIDHDKTLGQYQEIRRVE